MKGNNNKRKQLNSRDANYNHLNSVVFYFEIADDFYKRQFTEIKYFKIKLREVKERGKVEENNGS